MGARPVARIRLPHAPAWPQLRRRLLIVGLLLVALAAVYLLWFRDSSFVQVRDVQVAGAENDAGVEVALTAAGLEQSTLSLDIAALEAAVGDDPAVAAVAAEADFPHGLLIEVTLRRPAGYLADGGGAVLASDGVVLATGLDRPEGLAAIEAEPAVLGKRAQGPALAVAQVLGAVPEELAAQVESGRIDPEHGPTATLAGGLELRFGGSSRAEAKWRAASAVIADPDFAGADYLDLAVPSRPVAG